VTETRVRKADREADGRRGLITVHEELRKPDGELVLVDDHLTLLPFAPDEGDG